MKVKQIGRRIMALCLVIAIVFSISVNAIVFAEEPPDVWESDRSGINNALNAIEVTKRDFGLDQVDFSSIYAGEKALAYEYSGDGFEELYSFYPLFVDDDLVALAISPDGEHYQIDTDLVAIIKTIAVSEIALVYDCENCYLYTDGSFFVLREFEEDIVGRGKLNVDIESESIYTTDLAPARSLGYMAPIQSRASYYASCSVTHVTQNPPSSICWAASVACIVNYCVGVNLTAVDVAKQYYGEDYNNSATTTQVVSLLSYTYGLYYQKDTTPTDNEIYSSLSSDRPVYARFTWVNSSGVTKGHAVVIYFINTSSRYITVMDPEFGYKSAFHDGTAYTYVSSYSGVTLTLESVARSQY